MPLTDPYSPDAESAVRQVLRNVRAARVTGPGIAAPIPVDVTGGAVTFDESWAPHVQAVLTARVPEDQATLDAIDPRTLARVQIDAGYVYPGGEEDVHPLADLGLRERPVRRPDNEMTLHAASDEALIQDAGPLVDDVVNAPGWGLTAALTARMPNPLGYTPTIVSTVPASATVDVYMTFSAGSQWDQFKAWADEAEAELFDRGDRTWVLRPWPYRVAAPAHTLKVGSLGTVIASESTLSREGDDWANMVILRHQWTDADDVEHVLTQKAFVDSGPHQGWNESTKLPLPGLKLYTEARAFPTTATGIRQAAAAILRRKLRRARSFVIRARAAYWLRPGMTVAIQLPTGGMEMHLVSAVAFDLATGEMTVTTRHPDDATISTGA